MTTNWSFAVLSSFKAPLLIRSFVKSQMCCGAGYFGSRGIKRPDERVPEAVGYAPCMTALAVYKPLWLQFIYGHLYPGGYLAHMLIVAVEHAEVAGLGRIRERASSLCPPDEIPLRNRQATRCAGWRRSPPRGLPAGRPHPLRPSEISRGRRSAPGLPPP